LNIKKLIEAALDAGGNTHSYEDVRESIIKGEMQLWLGDEACAVTEIVVYPKKKVLHVFLASGKMESIVDMLESAEKFGKENGCSSITIAGRHGWKRVLSDEGFNHSLTVLEKVF
jgi:hypothetical protein